MEAISAILPTPPCCGQTIQPLPQVLTPFVRGTGEIGNLSGDLKLSVYRNRTQLTQVLSELKEFLQALAFLVPVFLFQQMHKSVAACAQCDEVALGVVSELTPWANVVNLEFSRVPAALTAPSIPLEHSLPESSVIFRVESLARVPREGTGHSVPLA